MKRLLSVCFKQVVIHNFCFSLGKVHDNITVAHPLEKSERNVSKYKFLNHNQCSSIRNDVLENSNILVP